MQTRFFMSAIMLLFLAFSTADAATWYVNVTTGNNAWTGVNSTNIPAGTGPKASIQAMVNGTLASGDIIQVAAGTYNEQVVITDKSITIQGAGLGQTIVRAAAWASLTAYTDAVNIAWVGAGRLPSSTFRPVMYVNASNTNFTVNIRDLTVDGNSVVPAAPGGEYLVGIMYRNAQGRIGGTDANSCGPYNVQIKGCRKATLDADFAGFGVIAMANSTVRVSNCYIHNFQNAGVLSLGRTTNTINRNLQPNPEVTYNKIAGQGAGANLGAGLHAGYMGVFGGRGTVSYNFIDSLRNDGAGYGVGVALIDPFAHTIGGNNRTKANVITNNELGLYFRRTVNPVGLFPPTFSISNNTIAYNGNGLHNSAATGAVVLDDTPGGAYTLNVSQNAWGNALASTLYAIVTDAGGDPTAGFFVKTFANDNINSGSAQSSGLETVSCNLSPCDMGLGYTTFPRIQPAVDAAAISVFNPTVVNILPCTYVENVLVQKPIKLIGDSLVSCGGPKPIIAPAAGVAMEISSTGPTAADLTQNVTLNGLHFRLDGAAHTGVLVVGWDGTAASSNNPPQDITVRNSCFQGYATQGADGVSAASAAMSTVERANNSYDRTVALARISWGGNVTPATPHVSDVDASGNNNFNYLGLSTSPDFKLWEKTDQEVIDGGATFAVARIIKTDLIIIYCGDDMEAVLGSLGAGPVTVYLQGDCVYKDLSGDNIMDINGMFTIKVDYTGRVQLPPVVVAQNGLRYGNALSGIVWDNDCTVPTKAGVRFITRTAAWMPDPGQLTNGHQPSGTVPNLSSTHMKSFAPVNFGASGFDYEVANYGWNRPTDIIVSGSNNGALVDAVSHIADSNGFSGTITLANAAAFTTNLTLQKRVKFTVAAAGAASTTGWIRLLNKELPVGPCVAPWGTGAINGILDTRVLSGTFTSLDVRVGTPAHATEWADNLDTTNTIQQGLVFTAAGGTCQVNYRGNYQTQTATIARNNVTLTSDDALQFVGGTAATGPVASITLNGSGACGGTASDIIRFNVPTVFMGSNVDCIQTALGHALGNQDDEGVGNSTAAGVAIATAATPRTGTVVFTYGGATSVAQTLLLDKDVKFDGNNATPNSNAGSLTMRLGAYGNPNTIVNSDNFCNTTVNVTQEPGSGYTTIPDIQDGILLACASTGTVNVGTGVTAAAAPTIWGGASNTYNRDNTINKSLFVQGLNNPLECANDPLFVIDAASAWPLNGARANTALFTGFTAVNPIFTIAGGVHTVRLRGFDFSVIADGAAAAVISAPGTGALANNDIVISNNFITNSGEAFLSTAGTGAAAQFHSQWTVQCNRMIANTAPTATHYVEMIDHTNTAINRNYFDGAAGNGAWGIVLRGFGGGSANNITQNVFQNNSANANLWVGNSGGSSNTVQNVNIAQNRVRGGGGQNIELSAPSAFTGAVTIANNFLHISSRGILMSGSTAVTHQFLSINNNSFENTNTGIQYDATYSATACPINARGNWWEHVSGPTSVWNPLNSTPCSAGGFGDFITQGGTCTSGDQSMIGFIPWWTLGTDANAGADGWQQPAAANVLARVVRTNSTGTWLSNHATIDAAGDAIAGNNERVIAIQGITGWLPVPGLGDDWGEYFSEQVTYSNAFTGNEFRGTSIKAYDCGAAAMRTWHTYLATTSNINGPVPSGDGIVHAPAAPISGQNQTGFYIDGSVGANADGALIRNFRIQGFSAAGTDAINNTQGKAILFQQVVGPVVDVCWVEGSNAGVTHGSVGVYLDRCTGGSVTSTMVGHNKDVSATSGSVGGIGILLGDRSNTNQTFGPNTVGVNGVSPFATALGMGIVNGHNIIRNCERVGITVGFNNPGFQGSMGATTLLEYNTIRGIRDSKGTGGVVAIAAIHANASGGDLRIANNTLGGKGLATSSESDNNVDIEFASNTFTLNAASNNNTIRDSAQVVDGENYTVRSVSGGARAAELRTFFNPASGNTFSHAAILTTDGTAPYNFGTQMTRNQSVVDIGGFITIYRQISTPLANTSTVYSAGSETYNNVVELRQNAGWTIGELDQYYGESLSFPSTTGRMHQTILGPGVANGLDATSAHLISAGPGTGVAVTADGRENKYIRGGIYMHAIGNGLYGRITSGNADNKGDVYLQRAVSGSDAGFVKFAYHASAFGSQAAVAGTGVETTGNNANADKPTIIKAGLDDANDDVYAITGSQNRRTGVFQAGNGTTFTRPVDDEVASTGVMSAYPMPASSGEVSVRFRVPFDGFVKVAVYDALGQKVSDLKADYLVAGPYMTNFDVNNLETGTYHVRMESEFFSYSVPVIVVK